MILLSIIVISGILLAAQLVSAQDASNAIRSQQEWKQYYFEAHQRDVHDAQTSREHTPTLEDLSVLEDRAVLKRGSRLNKVVALIGTVQNQAVIGFESWSTGRGSEVEFEFISIHPDPNEAVFQVDFDDGSGVVHQVSPGSVVTVQYVSTGEKMIQIQATGMDPSSTVFVVEALQSALIAPNNTWTVTATTPFYYMQAAKGNAYVYRAPSTTGKLRRPFIITEGFDPFNSNANDYIVGLLISSGYWDTIRANGGDIVIVDFVLGGIALQDNAMVLAMILQKVKQESVSGASIVLLGPSMGGLISRYTLTWMERKKIPHQVGLYISYDSPHRGASISLGTQYFLRFASGLLQVAKDALDRMIYSDAAKQMIVYHESADPGYSAVILGSETINKTISVGPNPMFSEFFQELQALGIYPNHTRKIAIANGNGNGVGENFTAGHGLLKYQTFSDSYSVLAESFVMGPSPSRKIFQGSLQTAFGIQDIRYYGSGVPFEYAPGAIRELSAEVVAMVGDASLVNEIAPYSEGFIPTLSAIDSAQTFVNPFTPVNQTTSPFDAVYFAVGPNEPHMTLSSRTLSILQEEILRITPAPSKPAKSKKPTRAPTNFPSKHPIHSKPTRSPSHYPTTRSPTTFPSKHPITSKPTKSPRSSRPTKSPSPRPTKRHH